MYGIHSKHIAFEVFCSTFCSVNYIITDQQQQIRSTTTEYQVYVYMISMEAGEDGHITQLFVELMSQKGLVENIGC